MFFFRSKIGENREKHLKIGENTVCSNVFVNLRLLEEGLPAFSGSCSLLHFEKGFQLGGSTSRFRGNLAQRA